MSVESLAQKVNKFQHSHLVDPWHCLLMPRLNQYRVARSHNCTQLQTWRLPPLHSVKASLVWALLLWSSLSWMIKMTKAGLAYVGLEPEVQVCYTFTRFHVVHQNLTCSCCCSWFVHKHPYNVHASIPRLALNSAIRSPYSWPQPSCIETVHGSFDMRQNQQAPFACGWRNSIGPGILCCRTFSSLGTFV